MMFDTRLPQPNDAFRWVQVASRHALVCRALEPIAEHFITTREWGLGTGPRVDDADGWREVADGFGVEIVRAHQVHGADVIVRRGGEPELASHPAADIIVSSDPAVSVAVQTADCVPILIADRRSGVVAAAHAGWRGLAAGVPRVAVAALAREFGSRLPDLLAAAGPSIAACCYEVGPEVRRCFEDAGWHQALISRWFFTAPQPTPGNPSMAALPTEPRAGHWYFDSGRAACDQLEAAGVAADHIYAANLCTASHPSVLCSYRRDGSGAGRIAAAIRARSRQVGRAAGDTSGLPQRGF